VEKRTWLAYYSEPYPLTSQTTYYSAPEFGVPSLVVSKVSFHPAAHTAVVTPEINKLQIWIYFSF
jgi:hypothetical protein